MQRGTADTFGRQWARFAQKHGRTWGLAPGERLDRFLTDVDLPPEWFPGKRVLDAGCGPGDMANVVATLGCGTTGLDISPSVERARLQFPSVHFVRGDLASPPSLQPFDLVYSGGVLHHSPSTLAALKGTCTLVAPGGRLYVWLYWKVPGFKFAAKSVLRHITAPLPTGLKDVVCVPFALQAWARNRSLTLHEHLLVQRDFFTPRWRWLHTPNEVIQWLADLGFDARLRTTSQDGFGVLADRRSPQAAENGGCAHG
jgi:SAM-dependent methyltransferase